ncbi:hypothetical protein evm_005952 [Chilo suppressalis]|nr:hypothetical protein evm_005952 [Chilo suppressalis]
MKLVVIFWLFLVSCHGESVRQARKFPDDFWFGAAIAAYQVEGRSNANGKDENSWDYITHNNPEYTIDFANGDIAADTYNNYKRDVEMMGELGLDAYRCSLSWSRILPQGFTNKVNEAGIAFYNKDIDEMLKYNIQTLVTLYHWDLPQPLQELGGFANPLFSEWFEDYARVAFKRLGDRVKFWITFNEPREICYEGYGADTKAPVVNATGVGTYICSKNLLIGHAKAYHAYANDFKPTQNG